MIGPYDKRPVECLEPDGRAAEIARRVADAVRERAAEVTVHHIGSTAVPGCAGKGVADLLVTYPPGQLEAAKAALDPLGFQRQRGREPFPEDRPMRVGSLDGHRIHAHVVAADAAEAAELLRFRDRLRADPALVRAYVELKQSILARGITDGVDYAHAKTEFIRRALAD